MHPLLSNVAPMHHIEMQSFLPDDFISELRVGGVGRGQSSQLWVGLRSSLTLANVFVLEMPLQLQYLPAHQTNHFQRMQSSLRQSLGPALSDRRWGVDIGESVGMTAIGDV